MSFKHLIILGSAALALAACAKRKTIEPEPTPTPGELQVMAESTPIPALPTPVPTAVPNSYVVQKGDSLWEVSGEPKTLGDHFRWPLLFRANRDQIIDPDLIEPGQDLTWKNDYSTPEISEAIQKAKDTPPYTPHDKPRKQLPLKY